MPVYNIINNTIIPTHSVIGNCADVFKKGTHIVKGKYGDVRFDLIGSKAKGDIVITDPTSSLKNITEQFGLGLIDPKIAMEKMSKEMTRILSKNSK